MNGLKLKPVKPLSENAKLKLEIVELKKVIKLHELKQCNIPVVGNCNCKKPEHWIKEINNLIIDYCKKCNKEL